MSGHHFLEIRIILDSAKKLLRPKIAKNLYKSEYVKLFLEKYDVDDGNFSSDLFTAMLVELDYLSNDVDYWKFLQLLIINFPVSLESVTISSVNSLLSIIDQENICFQKYICKSFIFMTYFKNRYNEDFGETEIFHCFRAINFFDEIGDIECCLNSMLDLSNVIFSLEKRIYYEYAPYIRENSGMINRLIKFSSVELHRSLLKQVLKIGMHV